jgi:hypothetical protein
MEGMKHVKRRNEIKIYGNLEDENMEMENWR